MKTLLTAITLSFCIYFCSSCTKTNNVTTTVYDTVVNKNPITGLWVGSYFVKGDAVDSFTYQFDIRKDGLVYTLGSGMNGTAGYASGPWTLSGTSFSATITSMNGVTPENVQTITATYDSVGGRLYNGVWTDIKGNTQSGTVSLLRIQ